MTVLDGADSHKRGKIIQKFGGMEESAPEKSLLTVQEHRLESSRTILSKSSSQV